MALKDLLRPLRRPLLEARNHLAVWGAPLLDPDVPLDTKDRFWLEQRVFPYFLGREGFQRVLFVGVAYYTKHYARYFTDREYWTMDPAPELRRYGSTRHVTDVVQHLPRYVQDGYFDAIFMNGVVGFGLDEPAEIEIAYAACRQCLRTGGILFVGWCDEPHRRCLPPGESKSLATFERFVFPPFGAAELVTDTGNHHTFSVFRKPT